MIHRYAEALRWIADGKDVQIRWGFNSDWLEMAPRNEMVNDEVLRGVGQYEFRIKPRTVKIGSREVEAPVLEPGDRQMVWCWDSDFNKPEEQYAGGHVAEPKFKLGLCFATEKACQAAHDAFHALLRGEA